MPAGYYEALWRNEAHAGYGRRGGEAPAYLPQEHKDRWHRLRHTKMLFEGKHRCYYLDELRTQFDYPEQEVNGQTIRPYHTFNLLKLVSVKTADLLFGAKVKLNAPSDLQTDAVDNLARRSMLHSRLHGAVVAASWSGGAFLDSMIWRDEPYIANAAAEEIYPIGSAMPDGQYERYVRYATAEIGSGDQKITLLLESEYQPGRIIRRLWQVDHEGRRAELSLDQWPAFGGNPPPNEEVLGIAENPITYLPNEVGGVIETSDYDGLIGLQDTVNAKIAQIARVIAQHTDPNLAMPAEAADPDGNNRSGNKVYYFRDPGQLPQYVVWNAQLEAARADKIDSINAFCMAAEMSQVLLGLKEGAAPDAARKLKLEATNTLAKVGRKALILEPAIARAIEVALRLDQTTRTRRTYPIDPIGVEPRDGLPVDELDEAATVEKLRGAGVMSIEAAVSRRIEDPDAEAVEVQRIKSESQASMPSVLLGEPGVAGSDPNATSGGNASQEPPLSGAAVGEASPQGV